ncbi:MAG: DOMON-like domain-containing protein [Azonexaceae bacterium]|nr:DOMON-like domain-containing protein [Azonexaceae bacterium]
MSAPKTAHLLNHPAAPGALSCAIAISAEMCVGGGLVLSYRVTAPPADILVPAPQLPGPADGLWQHTCCEAFVMEDGEGYREFNFSPSGQWAAYRFTGYRERDNAFTPAATPGITFTELTDGFELRANIPAALLPDGHSRRLGLTAVIEAADASKSYWALAHCAAQPDFHVRQSFALTLNRNTP